jgi:nucleotide-binding universal stress UspA family protein
MTMTRIWKTPRKLLCATDLTPSCDRAVDRAMQLASQWKARLLVLHVVDDTGLQTEDFAARSRSTETELQRQVKSHPAASGLDVDVVVTLGNPAERILSRCDRQFIDVLVMGTGQRTSIRQRLLGSTIDHVLRHALQPVLSIRNRAIGAYQIMAIATDFSPPSREALDCALAHFPEAKATVVHAYEDALHGLLASDQVTGPLAERHKHEMRALAEKSMEEFVEAARIVRPDLATAVEIGAPEAGLRHYLDQFVPDLVVVGTHGRTGLRRAVIGSIAERLIATLPCDVLAVRPTG